MPKRSQRSRKRTHGHQNDLPGTSNTIDARPEQTLLSRTKSWLPIAISLAVSVPAYCGNQAQRQQLELQKASQGQLAQHVSVWKTEFERTASVLSQQIDQTKEAFLASSFHAVLSDLSSSDLERKLAGLKTSRTFIENENYRELIAPSVITSLAEGLNAYADSRAMDISDLRLQIDAASNSLLASRECGHLTTTLFQLYDSLQSRYSEVALAKVGREERDRLRLAQNELRDRFARPAFCAFVTKCANRVDFLNAVDGAKLEFQSTSMADTIHKTIPVDTFTALSGYGHSAPSDANSPLVEAVRACSGAQRQAIKDRACSFSQLAEDGTRSSTSSCRLLSNISYLSGGWVGVGVTVTPASGTAIPPGSMR